MLPSKPYVAPFFWLIGLRVQGLGFKVIGFRVWGLGFAMDFWYGLIIYHPKRHCIGGVGPGNLLEPSPPV